MNSTHGTAIELPSALYRGPSAAQDLALYSERRLHGNLSDLFHARKLLLRLARQETSVKSIGKWSRKERDGGGQ